MRKVRGAGTQDLVSELRCAFIFITMRSTEFLVFQSTFSWNKIYVVGTFTKIFWSPHLKNNLSYQNSEIYLYHVKSFLLNFLGVHN